MKKIKDRFISILLVIILLSGIGLLAYPTVANWWNQNMASHTISSYTESIENVDESEINRLLEEAKVYNQHLLEVSDRFHPTDEEHDLYYSQLNISDSNVIGAINIPTIKVTLPIYLGTDETVLAMGAGHLEGSSLPVGGLGTHAVITGHRGLPSAELFTNLDQLNEDDYVILNVLNKTLTYQIDGIQIVLPSDLENLEIDPESDLLTLVTCTPYGVNTHRMLLTGHRVENLKEWTAVADAHQVDAKMVALFIAIPILILLFIVLMVRSRRPKGDPDEKA